MNRIQPMRLPFVDRRVAIALLALPIVTIASAAQQPATTQMVLKGRAPVSSKPLAITMPRVQQAVLPNGLRLLVLEDHRVPWVGYQMVVDGAGGYYDPPNRVGLAGTAASMLREGTAQHTSLQIAEALEATGASMSISGPGAATRATIAGGAFPEQFEKVLALVADVTLRPAFPQQEWERYRTRAKVGLVQSRTSPDFLASETLSRVVYGSHPGSRVTASGTALDSLTPAALSAFHRTHYVPERTVIAIAGDISMARARALVTEQFGSWARSGEALPPVVDPTPMGAPKVSLVARPGSVQTTLWVGTQGLRRTNPDYLPLLVANRVLGGVMGRLFRHLREEKGYTYGIGSAISATPFAGTWIANTSVRTEVTAPALSDLLAEIALLRDSLVPARELEDSKRAVSAQFALSLESPSQALTYYLDGMLYGLPASYWDSYPARIAQVSAAQVRAAARKYWDPARLQIVAVGDTTQIRETLAKLGTLEMYDVEGRLIR
ncbi:MAG: Peptidase inactive domain protein [Gemmatimonadetes bacterium]|nr:Peptidase inactive domain protein [Gemmatimonadota bacterium]